MAVTAYRKYPASDHGKQYRYLGICREKSWYFINLPDSCDDACAGRKGPPLPKGLHMGYRVCQEFVQDFFAEDFRDRSGLQKPFCKLGVMAHTRRSETQLGPLFKPSAIGRSGTKEPASRLIRTCISGAF